MEEIAQEAAIPIDVEPAMKDLITGMPLIPTTN
jgi:hypothetical protein